MKNLRAATALVILAALLVSGCSGSNSKNIFGYGVVVTEFSSDYDQVDSGEMTEVFLQFENRGDYEAKNVRAKLVKRGSLTGEDPVDSVDLELPIEGEYDNDYFSWSLTAPNLRADRSEEVQARINYDYQSLGVATIHFVPEDMLRDQGGASYTMDPYSSNAPLDIEINARQPVEIESEDPKEVQVTFLLSNVDTGVVESRKPQAELPAGCNGIALHCIDSVRIEGDQNCRLFGSSQNWKCGYDGSKWIWTNSKTSAIKDEDDFSASWCPAGSPHTQCLGSNGSATTDLSCDQNADNAKACYCSGSESTQLSETIEGVRLLHGFEGRVTKTYNFEIPDAQAATSCQFTVTADYGYRIDSDAIPININKQD